jgi:UDP-2-acetamido-3-amino-2,3-dideoxy-glucuronate N-acetyltransferase
MMKELNIALIGCGNWGKNIARNLHQMGSLACIYDSDTKLAEKLNHEYMLPTFELNKIFEDQNINAIVIASPAKTHKDLAIEAIKNDKDVFIEKPFCLSFPDAQKLSKLATNKKRILMVGHLLNYHNAFIKMKELIKNGKIGIPQNIRANRLALGAIRSEESVIYDLSVHDISMILSITEELPIDVNVQSIHHHNNNGPDAISVKLSFSKGLTALINSDWMCPYKEHQFSVIGTKGALIFDDTKSWSEKLLYNPSFVTSKNTIITAPLEKIIIQENEPLKSELKEFIDCLYSRKSPLTDHKEAVKVQTVMDMIDKKI